MAEVLRLHKYKPEAQEGKSVNIYRGIRTRLRVGFVFRFALLSTQHDIQKFGLTHSLARRVCISRFALLSTQHDIQKFGLTRLRVGFSKLINV